MHIWIDRIKYCLLLVEISFLGNHDCYGIFPEAKGQLWKARSDKTLFFIFIIYQKLPFYHPGSILYSAGKETDHHIHGFLKPRRNNVVIDNNLRGLTMNNGFGRVPLGVGNLHTGNKKGAGTMEVKCFFLHAPCQNDGTAFAEINS